MKQTTPVLSLLVALLLGLGLPSAIQAQGEAAPPATADPNLVPFAGPGEGLEAAVSGLDYRLGPGDGLVVAIWGPQPQVFEVKVDLEGAVLIPTVGLVDVRGDLLGEAKKKITTKVNRSYRGVTVTVTLSELRRFQVHVLGQVRRAGTYLATAVDRVSAAVGWSGGLGADSGARRIQVKNQGEIRAEADLPRFFRDGDMDSNPLLQDGDVIVVPFVGKQFSILGAVNAPGSYQFLPEDKLSDALELVGGFRTDAQAETLEVVRYPEGQEEPLRFFLTGNGELFAAEAGWAQDLPRPETFFKPVLSGLEVDDNIQYPDIQLHPDDVIFVRSIPVERKRRFVDVRGEVAFPGTYAITEGETTISQVVKMAGGFT
ncbi:MAG: hypothetical protein HKN21_08780, partial [Candidatus Eisenbacteria bacterium]|nr:hypothetical protein [Candidatus Eisenbacteria bacterium]